MITQNFVMDGSVDVPRMVIYRLPDGTGEETPARTSIPKGAVGDFREEKYYPGHQAVDFYHHCKGGIRYLADMGLNCMRFSIRWTHILPTDMEEKPNKEGLGFYEAVVDECLKHDIQPFIIVCHDEFPAYLTEYHQGRMSRVTIDYYVKFCRVLLERLGGRAKCWLAFNEVNILDGYSHLGAMDCVMAATCQRAHHMFVASVLAIKLGHEMMLGALSGVIYVVSPAYVRTCRPQDMFAQMTIRRCTLFYIDVMAREEYPAWQADFSKDNGVEPVVELGDKETLSQGTIDYISFSMYRSTAYMADSELKINVLPFSLSPYLGVAPWGWTIDPLRLRHVFNEFWGRYQLPFFAVENGLDTTDEPDKNFWVGDDYRVNYLKDHFKAIKDAAELDGIPVLSYTMWGGIDLVGLSVGEMKKQYGRVYAGMDDEREGSLKQYPRKSFYWMKDFMKNGSHTPLNS